VMASRDCRGAPSFCTVASVGPPAGTMIQTARGGVSLAIRSSSDAEPVAPSPPSCFTESALKSETTSLCPPRISRRVIFAPMRPNPTIPNCMSVAPSSRLSSAGVPPAVARAPPPRSRSPNRSLKSLLTRRLQGCQPRLQIAAQMHPQRSPPAVSQYLEIPTRLRCLHDHERIFLSRHRQFDRIVACDL